MLPFRTATLGISETWPKIAIFWSYLQNLKCFQDVASSLEEVLLPLLGYLDQAGIMDVVPEEVAMRIILHCVAYQEADPELVRA